MSTKSTILQTIRKHCLECAGGSVKEVELCTAENCALHLYRFGKDPEPNPARSKKMAGNDTAQVSNNSTARREKISQDPTKRPQVIP